MKTKFKLSNRILSLVLAFVMALGMMPMTRLTALAATEITPAEPTLTTDKHDINGDDTMDAVYEITTAAELFWFAEYVNAGNASACAKLMNDITVNENVIVNGALNSDSGDLVAWTPIGVRVGASTKVFSGTFDGGNHTISGLYVSVASGYQGLIGFMESGTVKNVTVANSYFSGTTNIGAVVGCYGQTGTASVVTNCHNVGSIVIASDYYVGGIVGGQYAPATSHAQIVLSNCSNSGSVTGAQHYVGGIIGYAEYFSEGTAISNCTNTGTVTNTSTNRAQGTGGIAGYFGGSSAAKVEIVHCTNSGKVSIATGGKQDYMGGIIGRNYYGHISACNNTGTISGYQYAGGIVGSNSGTVTDCQNTGAVISTYTGIGGIVGNNNGTVTGCTNSADVQGQWYVGGIIGTGIGAGLSDCTNTGDVSSNTYGAGGVIGYVDTAGTVENCHNEGKVKGTYYIGGLVGYHYSGKVNYTECSNKGTVEGSSRNVGGLFGRIAAGSTAKECYNTGGVTCTGTYNTTDNYGVGGLAGTTYNAVRFEDCYNTGSVNGGSNPYVGGLVGFFHYGSGSTENYIKRSHNTGSVIGGSYIGGLFGTYESNGVSEECYNIGSVSGNNYVGGLVGYRDHTGSSEKIIKNCYNTGSVSGTTNVGGLFGYSFYNNCLETSYNVGTVSGTSNFGGVIGNNKPVINCYYLDTCVTNGKTVTGATALTAQQMTDDANWKTNYAGFDTTTPVWSKQNNEGTKKYLPKLDSYSPTLHVHNWTYAAVDNNEDSVAETITAICNVDGCTNTAGGSVTISAPTDLVYSNSSKDAACSYSNWLPDKEETIVYNTVDRINVTGEVITASITIGEATASVSYQITPRKITNSMVILSPSSATYDRSEKTVIVTVKYSSKTLTAGADYEVTGTTSATEISTGNGYAVTVTGKGNYTGEATKYWKITKASFYSAIEIEGWTYGDIPKAPSVTNNPENGEVTYTYYISIGRRAVKTGEANGADAEGGVPKYAGTYYVGASIAETDLYNEKTISPSDNTAFVISPREVTEPTFEGLQQTYPYDNGNEIKPAFTLKDDLGNVIPESEYTVIYNNNTVAGVATITIHDITGGNYTVSGSTTFKIITHSHSWEYTASGTTITATCKADGCSNTDGGSVTLKVEDACYTGSAIGATVEGSFTNGATYKVTYNDSETVPSSIGTHTAMLTVYENGTEKQSVTAQYKISYLDAPKPAYTISGAYEDNGTYWFKSGASVTVNAPDGYTVCTVLNDTYGSSVSFSESDSKTIYLKRMTDGALTDAISVEGIRFDGNGATGKITIETRGFWEKLFNKITFGLFFKGNAVAKVSATDVDSGWKSIQYYVADEDLINENDASALEAAIGNKWNDYSNEITLNKNAKNVIYVKITDNVGNVTYLSSEGIVLYSDAEADTESVSTTYKAGEDKDVSVKLNGNTVKEIKNGTVILSAGTDYTVSANDTITLKASYIDTLSAGTYTFTISYNPLGETYVEAAGNEAPATTTITVIVEKADGKVSNIIISGKTYDGTAVTAPTFDKLGDGAATIEYKVKGAEDGTYTTIAPKNAGDYVARVTVAAGTNYKEASATAEFTIERATLTNVSVEQVGTLTYNGEALQSAVTKQGTALNGAEVLFMYSTSRDGDYGDMPTFTEAGTYTVYYCAYTTDNNFFDIYDTFTVTIDKATVTEPTIASKPYNGSAQTADISETDLYTVEKNEGGTAKGSYAVVLKLKDSANYKWSTTDNAEVTLQFVISAAQNVWDTKPAISGWTYGETAKTPVGAAKYGTVKVVYSGTANDGSDYNSETAPTKAGSYTATFTVDGTEDYSGLFEQVNFTIAKKAVTVTANDASKTYGDSDPALTYTNTALVGQDALVITVARVGGENAGTYTITASQAAGANPNYEITFKTGTFNINKAALTVTVNDASATYGDAVPTYTVKYDGFKNGDDKDDIDGALAFNCGYAQFDDKGEYTIKASGYTSGNYTISFVDGKLTVNAKPITVTIQNATSIYGEALAELKETNNGIVNGDTNVYSLATTATSTSNVGKYAITGIALDSNYDVTFANEDNAYEITKREITITVEAKNTIVNTALPTYTYKVEGLVGEDKLVTEPTLTCNADITVIGEYDITATGADAGGNYSIKYVPAKLTVLTDNAVDAAKGYEEEIKDLDRNTVTSEDKAELDEILEEINTLLDDETNTDNGKKALEETKEKVEELIKEITDAAEATDTENTEKVEDVTADNVTPDNKTNLEGAKTDLEKALEDHGNNMTDDEKKAVEDEIKRIDDALKVIENVETVEDKISKLPETITKNDEAAIKAADDAYNALTDYEKSLVDEAAKKALTDAKAALAELNKTADPNSPATGDNSNIFLWIALLFISGGAVITLTVVDRKRRMSSNR